MERSASAVWIFIMDFHQKEVNHDTVAVLCLMIGRWRLFLRFSHFLENDMLWFSLLLCLLT